jgi:hypothetical protein
VIQPLRLLCGRMGARGNIAFVVCVLAADVSPHPVRRDRRFCGKPEPACRAADVALFLAVGGANPRAH